MGLPLSLSSMHNECQQNSENILKAHRDYSFFKRDWDIFWCAGRTVNLGIPWKCIMNMWSSHVIFSKELICSVGFACLTLSRIVGNMPLQCPGNLMVEWSIGQGRAHSESKGQIPAISLSLAYICSFGLLPESQESILTLTKYSQCRNTKGYKVVEVAYLHIMKKRWLIFFL